MTRRNGEAPDDVELDDAEEIPPAGAIPDPGSPLPATLPARVRQELKEEQEKDKLADAYAGALAGLDLENHQYRFSLYRLKPTHFMGRNITGLLTTYDAPPDIEDIMEEHGGEVYQIRIKGPNPKDPKKTMSKPVDLPRINHPPKTASTPDGAIPLNQLPPAPPPTNEFASVIGTMLERQAALLADQAKASREDMKALVMSQRAIPAVDPELAAARAEAAAERQRQHEKELAKITADTEARKAADDRADRQRQASEDKAEKERQRQHDLALKQIDAQAAARKEEEATRRHEQQKLADRIEASEKASATRFEKMMDQFTSQVKELSRKKDDDDPVEKILKLNQLMDVLKGDQDNKPTEIQGALAKVLTQLPDKADKLITVLATRGSAPAKKQIAAKTVQPGSVAAAGPVTVVQEPSAEPTFAWPTEGMDPGEQAKLLARNVEAALNSRWDSKRIYDDVVKKFEVLRPFIKVFSQEQLFSAFMAEVGPESVVGSPRGKQSVRIIHALLTKEA